MQGTSPLRNQRDRFGDKQIPSRKAGKKLQVQVFRFACVRTTQTLWGAYCLTTVVFREVEFEGDIWQRHTRRYRHLPWQGIDSQPPLKKNKTCVWRLKVTESLIATHMLAHISGEKKTLRAANRALATRAHPHVSDGDSFCSRRTLHGQAVDIYISLVGVLAANVFQILL